MKIQKVVHPARFMDNGELWSKSHRTVYITPENILEKNALMKRCVPGNYFMAYIDSPLARLYGPPFFMLTDDKVKTQKEYDERLDNIYRYGFMFERWKYQVILLRRKIRDFSLKVWWQKFCENHIIAADPMDAA